MIKNLLLGNITQQEILNYYNATIINTTLPTGINGYVFNYRNINCIVINKNITETKKRDTLLHELAHIELSQLNQFDKDLFAFKINKYEDEADSYLKFILESIKEVNNGIV